MAKLTDQQLLAQGDHVICACHNAIPLSSAHCPYCNKFNAAGTLDQCPTCGQAITYPKEE